MRYITVVLIGLMTAGCGNKKGVLPPPQVAPVPIQQSCPMCPQCVDTPKTNAKAPNTHENRSWGTYVYPVLLSLAVLYIIVLWVKRYDVCNKAAEYMADRDNKVDVLEAEVQSCLKENISLWHERNDLRKQVTAGSAAVANAQQIIGENESLRFQNNRLLMDKAGQIPSVPFSPKDKQISELRIRVEQQDNVIHGLQDDVELLSETVDTQRDIIQELELENYELKESNEILRTIEETL